MAANIDEMQRLLLDVLTNLRTSSSFVASAQTGQASSAVNLKEQLDSLSQRFAPFRSGVDALNDEFNRLRAEAERNTNREARASSLRQIDAAQNRIVSNQLTSSLFNLDSTGKTLSNTFSTLTTSSGSMLRSFQQSGDSVTAAGNIFGAGIDLITNGAKTASDTLGRLADMSRGKLRNALNSAAGAFGLFNITGQATKFLFEMLTKELEKTITAYATLTSAGALYANGLTGMREAAKNSGLTLGQFSNMVKNSTDKLAELGIGIGPAASKVGEVLLKGGDNLKTKLLNLGFNFEEHGALVAEVMRDMRQSGEIGQVTDEQIAKRTGEYAENLRILSAVTGQDARKRMDTIRQEANTLAFQQKLAGMDSQQRQNVLEAMANMSDLQRKNFMDTVLFGTVINREGAAAAAMSQSLTASVNQYASEFTAGKLTPDSVRAGQSQFGDAIKNELLGLKEVGLAAAANATGIVKELAKLFEGELDFRRIFTPKSIEQAKKDAAALANTTDPLTKNLHEAQIAVQKFAIVMETILSRMMPNYTGLLSFAMEKQLALLEKAASLAGIDISDIVSGVSADLQKLMAEQQMAQMNLASKDMLIKKLEKMEMLNADEKTAMNAIIQELKNATTDQAVQAVIPRILDTIEKRNKRLQGEADGTRSRSEAVPVAVVSFPDNMTKAAFGDVLSGPRSGYMAMLHGTEAVIPLPDGRSVPVSIESKNETSETSAVAQSNLINKLIAIITGQTDKYEKMLEINGQMLIAMNEQYRVSRDMLNNSYA